MLLIFLSNSRREGPITHNDNSVSLTSHGNKFIRLISCCNSSNFLTDFASQKQLLSRLITFQLIMQIVAIHLNIFLHLFLTRWSDSDPKICRHLTAKRMKFIIFTITLTLVSIGPKVSSFEVSSPIKEYDSNPIEEYDSNTIKSNYRTEDHHRFKRFIIYQMRTCCNCRSATTTLPGAGAAVAPAAAPSSMAQTSGQYRRCIWYFGKIYCR